MHSAKEYSASSQAHRHSMQAFPHFTPRSPLFYVYCFPAVVAAGGIIVPFGMMLYYTLTDKMLAPYPYHLVGLTNYTAAFTDPDFWHALSVTLLYAVLACVIEVPLGIAIAHALSHDFRGVKALRVAAIIPMMIPPVVGSLVWKMMLNPTTGVLTFFLDKVGVHNFCGFACPSTALPTIVVVDVWLFTPFVILIVLAALRSVPHEVVEAAVIDGASAWHTFWRIVLPLISPYVVLVTLFRIIDSLKAFDTIYATTGGGPVTATMNFPLQTYMTTFQWHEVGSGLVYMALLWVVIFIVSQFMMRWWHRAHAMK